jgi:hypothetical protein
MWGKETRGSALVLAALTAALVGSSVACGGSPAGPLAKPPAFEPKAQAKCGVTKSQAKPLVVEWPSADRAQLEAQARRGLVVVRYEGCEMEVLDHCTVGGSYAYTGITRKDDRITMRDSDDLYANIPVFASRFEGKLQTSGELHVAMTIVGRFSADRRAVGPSELQGDCGRATHVLTALTAGAFEFYAGADAEIGAGAQVGPAGTGARSSARRETLNRDGDEQSCERSHTSDKAPPEGCGALLRVEATPLLTSPAPAAAPSCPPGSSWDGARCATTPARTRGGFWASPLAYVAMSATIVGVAGTIGFAAARGSAVSSEDRHTTQVTSIAQADPGTNYGQTAPCGADSSGDLPHYAQACESIRTDQASVKANTALMGVSIGILSTGVLGTVLVAALTPRATPAAGTPGPRLGLTPYAAPSGQGLLLGGTF